MKITISRAVFSICVGITLFAAISCVSRRSEVIKERPFVPANEHIANGEKVFMEYCHKCHPGGEAGIGPSINANELPQFVKRFQVRHGLGVMPSFKKRVLTKSDLHDLSKFLRAWKSY